MDLGTVLSAAQTLYATLQCAELKEVCSILGYKSELEKLKNTVNIVKAVLRDADSKQMEGDHLSQTQIYIDVLKYAVYDAEDLLDEFSTLARLKKLIKGGNVSKKVRVLFSRFNPLATAHKMSRGVKEIRKRLDDIANEHDKFGFKVEFQPKLKLDCEPIRRRILTTCSYIGRQDIIGREDDIENIVGRLLNQDVQRDVSCLAIVGIGGLGKSALAQRVYNDTRIEKEFPLRSWACISDQDPKILDVKAILCKILDSATGGNHEKLQMEPLQKEFREQLGGKKFFIVLDDVWIEDRYQWLELENFLITGLRGSCIVVTTRSEITATVIGVKYMHKLKGLSKEDSRRLFEMTAFGHTNEQAYPCDLVEIGHGIVQRCANVPLAIRVVGSLLYGHGKEKWLSFQNIGLGRLKYGGNGGIESIHKLSYDNLDSRLKTCFSYCALFPKDHDIEKEMLINLWMAQDYIVPLQEGQSLEDVGEEYFSILLKRCFFQDIKKDEYDNIISCKIHDLMHDIAQEVGRREIYASNYFTTNLDDRIRHLSYLSSGEEGANIKSKIRTVLCVGGAKNIYLWIYCYKIGCA